MAVVGGKKRAQGRSKSPDRRVKREASFEQKFFQKEYRIEALKQRITEDRMTLKNVREARSLGMNFAVSVEWLAEMGVDENLNPLQVK